MSGLTKLDSEGSYSIGKTLYSREGKDTISKLQPGATGPDGIHNLMLKNLPDAFVVLLTELFNRYVIESAIPSEWNKAIVIPLLKADHIQIEQLGFLPGRSTTDALVRLEHLIKLSFKKGKAVYAIFLDMDSAFDRVDVGRLSVLGLPDLLANSNNMVFSTHKSVNLLFHKIHNLAAFKPRVELNGQGIIVAEHACFLGVVFDQKMTWKPHLDELIGSLKQRQNFINALCLGRRGAPTAFASTIVKSVVISIIDYGSFM
ncbi:hypothetical protein QYM36_011652 [Artemia franciscana]|uniref:Reverse transcriptase domain-containing protein n=1 Tax=Artemia franciscana TaxID=6661 RepID=A0AA88HKR0_ARTSF|nr:hypothetical protein QYM36_011652 [Artemia franciscana]